MHNIDIFNNTEYILQSKYPRYIKPLMIIIMIFLFSFTMLAILYSYPGYLKIKGIIVKDEEEYYLKLLLKEEDINKLNNYLYINDEKYQFSIINIGNDYIYDEKYNKYLEVFVTSDIAKDLVINNNILDVTVKLPKTTFFKEIVKEFKEGIQR